MVPNAIMGGRKMSGYRVGNAAVTVFIAALNEQDGIGLTIQEVKRVLKGPFFLVVDGKSVDKTAEIAERMGAKVITQDDKGKGQAVGQGIRELPLNSKYVVFIDADFTYPAEYIPEMIEILDQNPHVGMVVGNRFNGKMKFRESSSDVFFLGNRMLALAQHVVNGIKLQDPLSGLRVVRAEILKYWKPRSKGFDVEAEMNYLVENRKYRIVEVPIVYRPRMGQKKLKLRDGFAILNRILIGSIA